MTFRLILAVVFGVGLGFPAGIYFVCYLLREPKRKVVACWVRVDEDGIPDSVGIHEEKI